MTTSKTASIKVIQHKREEHRIVSSAMPTATAEEVSASTCSCVVHLCGCK